MAVAGRDVRRRLLRRLGGRAATARETHAVSIENLGRRIQKA